jgi:polysaccharide export outer membrane protein
MRHCAPGLAGAALLVLLGGAPAVAQPAAPEEPNGVASRDLGDYRIGPEDVLRISVWNNEAMSATVPVRPDGRISLPLLNDVQAAGLTAAELREVLAKRLVEYMPIPEVSVIVMTINSFKVSILGEVTRPGRYDLRSRTTVLDALALAGGLGPFAAKSRIVILRPEGNSMKRIPFNYNKLVGDGLLDRLMNFGADEQENLYLRNGDIILVP